MVLLKQQFLELSPPVSFHGFTVPLSASKGTPLYSEQSAAKDWTLYRAFKHFGYKIKNVINLKEVQKERLF